MTSVAVVPGVLLLLHAAYSALEHRAYLKASHEAFAGLPIDVRCVVVVVG